MNEQLAQKLIDYLNTTEAFLASQAPEFVQQYLTWCFYEKLFWVVLLVGVGAITLILHLLSYYKADGNFLDDMESARSCV
jgi:hypothetical protein